MRVIGVAIFAGAFLLFQVQPIIGKFILPWFGGSPAVWTTCMLFFQTFLLAGYGYAHWSATSLKPRAQSVLHCALVAAALLFLPIHPGDHWKPVSADAPTLRILALLLVSLGLPYFLLSATGPLLQSWFNRLYPGASPYRLYALSNTGSLLALISFPIGVEPFLTRRTQSYVWSGGFCLFALLCAVCARRLWRTATQETPKLKQTEAQHGTRPQGSVRMLWVALSACASVQLLATTNKMCQDVAVVPFLWVLPLSVYLLSFIICFDSPGLYFRNFYTLGFVAASLTLCWTLFEGVAFPIFLQIGIYAGALFFSCMVCHGELFRLRPPPQHLTGFYFYIAAGGALGGVLVAVGAPRLFNSYAELNWSVCLLAALLLLLHARERTSLNLSGHQVAAWKPGAVVTLLLGALLATQAWLPQRDTVLTARNFYGVMRVRDQGASQDRYRVLEVGDIVHGVQFQDPARARQPTTYFDEQSGIGLALQHWPEITNRHIGIIGLGVGTLASYGQAGDSIRFYEINPAVIQVAREQFTFLTSSQARIEIVVGDARLSLEAEQPAGFDIFVLDAFTSDAIPVHLLTREALELYLRHLKSDGLMAVHISNRHLNLRPVVQALAHHFNLENAIVVRRQRFHSPSAMESTWVLLSKRREFFAHPAIDAAAASKSREQSRPLWTDDYASLFPLLTGFAATAK